MRVRNVALFFLACTLLLGASPFAVRAATSQSTVYRTAFVGLPTIPYTLLIPQTALRAGDTPTLQVGVHSPYGSPPAVSVDLSQLGVPSPTTTPAGPGSPNYNMDSYYNFGPFTIGPGVPDGLKTISVTAIDAAGSVATATARIIVDNALPIVTVSNITFSTTSPRGGDYMYLSGKLDGTGSVVKASRVIMSLTDATGKPVVSNVLGGSTFGFNPSGLNAALAGSADGSFSHVPIQLIDFGDTGWIPRATNLNVDITAYDEAGNIASGNLTVLIPKPPPPDPCASGGCVSNVLFLPGIEASRLSEDMPCTNGVCSTRLWEPNGDALASRLAHDASGASVNTDIYATGVIDNAYVPIKGNIYKSFIEQMNGLVAAGTINAREATPYDWRLSLDQILGSGAQIAPGKISYLTATSSPYIIQELKHLAATSKTGKVTIIAHSNGGLLTKRLIEKLGADAAKYVDKIVFVAVPQAGTPQAVGALLHGYDQGLPTNFTPYELSNSMARTLATNMPMTYNLLPSATYFTQVDAPVVTFTDQPLLAPFRARYGSLIHSQGLLHTFLVDPWRTASSTTEGLNYPSVGNEPLLSAAETLHTDLDSWAPPAGVMLYEIAGWGEKTLAGIDYYQGISMHCDSVVSVLSGCTKTLKIDYHPRIVLDGDGTVVTPSALWTPGAKRYWVDLKTYNGFFGITKHASILEVPQLRTFIQNIIMNRSDSLLPQYISTSTPINLHPNPDSELHFTLHSPLTLNLYDDQGRHTGFSTTTGELEENIPDSNYLKFGEVQFISAPASLHTRLIMSGYAAGSFTLDAEEVQGETVTSSTTFAGVPTTANATATLDLPSGGLANAGALVVDENGDGLADISLTPKLGVEVVPDITPPEIRLGFSTTTKAVMFTGSDDSGSVIVTATTTCPVFKKDKKEEEKNRNGTATTTVTARDAAGNTTTLIYTRQVPSSDERYAITLRSLSYNSATTTLVKTQLQYKWEMNKKGKYEMFDSYLRTASSAAEARYEPKKNVTIITTEPQELDDREGDDEDSRQARSTLPGFVIPGLQTGEGSTRIIY